MPAPLRRIVYVLKNGDSPPRFYTGVTANLRARLEAHNVGRCAHTAKYRPWVVDLVVKFADEPRALQFEKYLKSGSGCAFAQRHLQVIGVAALIAHANSGNVDDADPNCDCVSDPTNGRGATYPPSRGGSLTPGILHRLRSWRQRTPPARGSGC